MTLTLDHLAISATDLASGVAHVESVLGVALAGGGEHAHMSTHNRLLHLGDIYLEVIAINPAAPAPAWPRALWPALSAARPVCLSRVVGAGQYPAVAGKSGHAAARPA